MKYLPAAATRILLVVSIIALAPLVGCIPRYVAWSSTSGSGGTYGGTYGSTYGGSTFPGNSTYPLDGGSSSSSDPYVTIRQPVVVAQGPSFEEEGAGESETGAAKPEAAKPADPLDWTYLRGPEYNGTSRETGLPDSLDIDGGEGSNLLWKNEDIRGRSTPIVMNGKLYTLMRAEPGTPREGEKVVCLDANTGKVLWENRFNVWLSDVPDTRVGWSSVVGDPETGNVYALGVCDYFQCINGETGETVWSIPMHERFGMLSTYGGRTNFPVIFEDLVIVSGVIIGWGEMAKPEHRFIAMNKRTGEVVWINRTTPLPDDTTYSAPAIAVLGGQQAMVAGGGDGNIWAFQPRTGLDIWTYRFSMRGINTAPIIANGVVYAGHSEENIVQEGGGAPRMGGIAALKGELSGDITETGELWLDKEYMIGKASPLLIDDRLYCIDDRAKLFVLDAENGEELDKMTCGTMMRGGLLYADGKLYVVTAGASRWYVLKPDADGLEVVNKGRFNNGEEVQAAPIVSHGKLYVQSSDALYCFEDKTKKHGSTAIPAPSAENPVAADQKPAHVQVIPADLLMEPGRIVTFKARVYNSLGQLLDVEDVEFSLEGAGEMTPDGTYLAPSDNKHQAVSITASVGDAKGKANVRIEPRLPWTFDFEGLKDPPVTWIGARYRHVIREMDGSNVMAKITTIPKGTRSRGWFGFSDLSDYTIQADVRGALMNDKLPDIGLIAQGYTLDLQGESQKLEIRTWVTQRRMAKAIDFAWKPDVWYTMKLQAKVVDSAASPTGKRAILSAKIWPRGEEEPKEWTLEATDDSPNLSGSPGLYGNAKDAELYLDNIRVYANSEAAE